MNKNFLNRTPIAWGKSTGINEQGHKKLKKVSMQQRKLLAIQRDKLKSGRKYLPAIPQRSLSRIQKTTWLNIK